MTTAPAPRADSEVGEVRDVERPAEDVVAEEGTPWHFKLLVGAVGAYLLWRAVQMISWLF